MQSTTVPILLKITANVENPSQDCFSLRHRILDIDMAKSFFVGDTVSDVEAAINAGCKPIMVLTGLGEEQKPMLS